MTCSAGSCEPLYRCQDCFIGQPTCKLCCLSVHSQQPLHIIEVSLSFLRVILSIQCLYAVKPQEWNGKFFKHVSLKELGLHVQLGHPIGISCINPRPVFKPFFVLHSNGIHEVAVDYCDCDKKGDTGNWRIQCLQREWMPATRKNPETCCTFRMMVLKNASKRARE